MSVIYNTQRLFNLPLSKEWNDTVIGQSFYLDPVKGNGYRMDKSKECDEI